MGDHQWDDGEARELVIAIVCVYKSLLRPGGSDALPGHQESRGSS